MFTAKGLFDRLFETLVKYEMDGSIMMVVKDISGSTLSYQDTMTKIERMIFRLKPDFLFIRIDNKIHEGRSSEALMEAGQYFDRDLLIRYCRENNRKSIVLITDGLMPPEDVDALNECLDILWIVPAGLHDNKAKVIPWSWSF